MEREKLKSRLGFILISAGCAIGIGNVWKFAYMAGQGGGGFFVLLYLLFLVMLGIPIMSMEFAVGRASQKSPAQAYKALEKAGQKSRIYCFNRQLFTNDVLHNGCRLDALLFLSYKHRKIRWT